MPDPDYESTIHDLVVTIRRCVETFGAEQTARVLVAVALDLARSESHRENTAVTR